MNEAIKGMTVAATSLDGSLFIPTLPSPTLTPLLQRLNLAVGKADGYLANPAVIAQMEAPLALPHSLIPEIYAVDHGAHHPFAFIPLMVALLLGAGLLPLLQPLTPRKNERNTDTPVIQP